MKLALIAIALLLAGCATCRDHPVACGLGAAIAVGAVVIAADHGHQVGEVTPLARRDGPTCREQSNGTCVP